MILLDINPSTSKKTHFVFSGGGARGVWQWDLYNLLKPPFNIVSVSGTSTGSLTAMAAALNVPYEYMNRVYKEVCSTDAKDIFEPNILKLKDGKLKKRFFKLLGNLNLNFDGFMRINPLIKTIERILTEFPVWHYEYYFSFVDLRTGATITCSPSDFDSRSELARGIAASCAIPGLVEPIRDLKTKTATYACCVDGGVREGFPLRGVFNYVKQDEYALHQIIGLGCNAKEMTPEEDLKGIVKILGATAYNALNETMLGDIESAQLVNALVRSDAETGNKKEVPIVLFYYKGGRGTLEFTPDAWAAMKVTARDDFDQIVKTIDLTA